MMDYLKEIENAAPVDRFSLASDWMFDFEHARPFFDQLRAQKPILKTNKATIIANYKDVIKVLTRPDTYTVEHYVSKLGGDYMLAQDDTPLHTRDKSVMRSMMNRDDLDGVARFVADYAGNILAKQDGNIELVNFYARVVPVALVREYFGFEGSDLQKLKEWSFWIQWDSFNNYEFSRPANREDISAQANRCRTELREFLIQLCQKILAQGDSFPDTVVGRMLETKFPDAVGFPFPTAVRNMAGLLIGAVETTAQAVIHVIAEILSRPDVLNKAIEAAKDDSSEFPSFVWEALRFRPIAPYLFRKTSRDVELVQNGKSSVTLLKGETVLALTHSAMFDERKFLNPNEFRTDREWRDTFHFGLGAHECLGKYIGMILIPEMVKQVILLPQLKQEGEIDFDSKPFPENYVVSWAT